MELHKKFLMGAFLGVASFGLYAGDAYAKVDIELEDNKEDKSVTVYIDSKNSYIDGVNMDIMFSEGVTISNIVHSEEVCSLGKSNDIQSEKISFECFNDSNTDMNGIFATFNYTTENDEYFFYVDQDTLDIGTLPLGVVTDINKPVLDDTSEVAEVEDAAEDVELGTLEQVRDFLTENSLYVLAGVIFLISCVVAVVGLSSKDSSTE